MDAAALPHGDLHQNVRGGAETVKPERAPLAGHAVAAPADQSGAEQRRERRIITLAGQGEAIARVGDRVGRVAAVAWIAGEKRRIAEVFAPAAAIGADAAGGPEPRHADARS